MMSWIDKKRTAIQNYKQELRSKSDQYNIQKELCKDSKRIDTNEIEEFLFNSDNKN